jgi:hypothetical protein
MNGEHLHLVLSAQQIERTHLWKLLCTLVYAQCCTLAAEADDNA